MSGAQHTPAPSAPELIKALREVLDSSEECISEECISRAMSDDSEWHAADMRRQRAFRRARELLAQAEPQS